MPTVDGMMGSDATAHTVWGYVMRKQHGARKCILHINIYVRIGVKIYMSIDSLQLPDGTTAVDSESQKLFFICLMSATVLLAS